MFWFQTPPAGNDWAPRLVIYGDMGNENAQSLVRLQEETQRGLYDAVLHIGDFAYDMDSVSKEHKIVRYLKYIFFLIVG